MHLIEPLRNFINDKVRIIGLEKLPYILAFVVGICSGLAAVLLKSSIHFIKDNLTGWFNVGQGSLLYLAYPGVGILIAIIYVKYFVKDNIGHGITKVLYSISRNNSSIKPHNTYSSMVAGSVTIGFGGSVGAEAPIVLTGSAIGRILESFSGLTTNKSRFFWVVAQPEPCRESLKHPWRE